MATATKTIDLGEFEFEHETPGTYRYSIRRNGRKLTQYVSKTELPDGPPDSVKVTLTYKP